MSAQIVAAKRQNPNDFLKQIIGRPVVVKLNSGVDYRGKGGVAGVQIYLTRTSPRCSGLSRWLHEYCFGTNRGKLNVFLELLEIQEILAKFSKISLKQAVICHNLS